MHPPAFTPFPRTGSLSIPSLPTRFHNSKPTVEFDGKIALDKIWPALTQNGRMSSAESEASEQQLRSGAERPGTVADIIQHFITYGLKGRDDDDGNGGAPRGTGSQATRTKGQQQEGEKVSVQEGTQGGSSSVASNRVTHPEPAASAFAVPASLQLPSVATSVAAAHSPTRDNQATLAAASSTNDPQTCIPNTPSPLQQQPRSQPRHTPRAAVAPAATTAVLPSGAASPTAASERSATSAAGGAPASVASTIPFSFLARQRRQQQHEGQLSELSEKLVSETSAAFDARMRAANCELEMLRGCNEAAAGEYEQAADVASALAQFAHDASARQAATAGALALAPEVLQKLTRVEAAVGALEGACKALERRAAAVLKERERERERGRVVAAAAPVAVGLTSSVTASASVGTAAAAAAAAAAAGAVSSGFSSLVGGIGDGGAAAYKMMVGGFRGAGGGAGVGGEGQQGGGALAPQH